MSIDTDRLSGLAHKPRASHKPPTAPTYVYLLAEHLDAALAAGEDLLAKSFTWNTANPNADGAADAERAAMRHTFREIQQLEILIVARALRAREHAITLERKDTNFRKMAGLFISSVTVLMDAVAEMKDPLFQRFETGDALTAYMRSRGILDDETPAPIDCSIVDIPGFFRIARRIELGALMDLLAMFLDALEIRFDIFVPDDEAEYADIEKLSALTVRGDPLAAIRRAVAEPVADTDEAEPETIQPDAGPVAAAPFGLRVVEPTGDHAAATATAVEVKVGETDAAVSDATVEDVKPELSAAAEPEAILKPVAPAETAAETQPEPAVAATVGPADTETVAVVEAEAATAEPVQAEAEAEAKAEARPEVESEAAIDTARPETSPEKDAMEYQSLLARLNAIVGPEEESVTRKPPKLPPSPTVDDTLKTIALVGQIFREPLVPVEAPGETIEGPIEEAPSEVRLAEVTLEPPTPEPAATRGDTIDAEYEDVVCAS